jgi:hypothetical protein
MIAGSTAIDYAARRLVVGLPGTYDAAREHYEALVPEVDSARSGTRPLLRIGRY